MSLNNSVLNKQNNFDLIRLLAAMLVFIEHAWPIFTWKEIPFDLCRFLFGYSYGAIGILVFFSLSGFLVAHSFIHTNHWLKFLIKRFLRIWPALAVNIILTILVLGLAFSTVRFGEFITHQQTLQYLQNILIYRNYYLLPGVFESAVHSSSVNGSLWTIPYEFTCYLILSLLFLIKFIRNKWFFTLFSLCIWIIYLVFQEKIDLMVIPIIGITFKSLMLPLSFFLSGVCFYLWRDKIQCTFTTALFSAIGIVGIAFGWLPRELMILILPFLVFTFAFSKRIRFHQFGKWGDLSYGFYLYAYPVQQSFASIGTDWPFAILFISSLLTTLLLAFVSWHLVEKPSLKLKKKLHF